MGHKVYHKLTKKFFFLNYVCEKLNFFFQTIKYRKIYNLKIMCVENKENLKNGIINFNSTRKMPILSTIIFLKMCYMSEKYF